MARNPGLATFVNKATPLMVGGVLYVSTSLSQVAAINLPRPGWPRRGFPLVTRTLLFAAQEGRPIGTRWLQDRPWVRIWTWAIDDPALEVFDKTTGALLARLELPANAQGALMTYMARGRQYIVIPVGGANLPAELVALALP